MFHRAVGIPDEGVVLFLDGVTKDDFQNNTSRKPRRLVTSQIGRFRIQCSGSPSQMFRNGRSICARAKLAKEFVRRALHKRNEGQNLARAGQWGVHAPHRAESVVMRFQASSLAKPAAALSSVIAPVRLNELTGLP